MAEDDYEKMFREGSYAALFLELAKPDKDGFSQKIPVTKFTGKYSGLTLGNGGNWCRDDGPLGRKFNVIRHKMGRPIVSIELQGFNKNPIVKQIPRHIRDALKGERCVVLGTSNTEIDHKDGRRDDPRLSNPKLVKLSDFQPLSKAANNAKRQHCKTCRETDNRFDATTLGYRIAQYKGDGRYRGTCVGCYWHDPIEFNKALYKSP